MTSNHVLGIKAVLADGEVVELGGDSLENVGPDLVGLFVGSEGLFGIALEITLRLLPKPELYRTILAAYRHPAKAGDAVAAVVASGLLPGALEIMDRLGDRGGRGRRPRRLPPGRGRAADRRARWRGASRSSEEFSGSSRSSRHRARIEIRVAQDEADRLRIWKGRKSAFSAVGPAAARTISSTTAWCRAAGWARR